MKNVLIASLLVAAFLSFGTVTQAAELDCSIDVCANGDPNTVQQAWGQTGNQSIRVKPGVSYTDSYGFTQVCPISQPFDCYNLVSTTYYHTQMLTLAKQLITQGVTTQFSIFAGWVSAAR